MCAGGLYAARLKDEEKSKEGALHRTALNSKLGTAEARQHILEAVTALHSGIVGSKNNTM